MTRIRCRSLYMTSTHVDLLAPTMMRRNAVCTFSDLVL
jgi:hypothetical protein